MKQRYEPLDALRGIAIIGMVLSGTIAAGLPAWMYHAQVGPRSAMKFDPSWVGITWVDLVFPFFLFAMGAAFPLAILPKLKSKSTEWSLVPAMLKRALLLVLFAVAIYHTTPYRLAGDFKYWLSLLAFVLFFFSFVRLPKMSVQLNELINNVGVLLLIALMVFNVITQPDVFTKGFKLSHNDIIILVLANMAFFGALLWLLTRSQLLVRLGVLVFLFALRISSGVEGSWNQWLWSFNPMQYLPENIVAFFYNPGGWLYRMEFLKYLFIVIPGTIAGELIYKRLQKNDETEIVDSKRIAWPVLLLMAAMVVSNLVCLFARWTHLNLLLNIMWLIAGYLFLRKSSDGLGKLWYSLFRWGAFWLLLGTIFEAYEGGIRKDSATYSYFFLTSGLAAMTLIFFSVWFESLQLSRVLKYVTRCGQNPMVAYVAGTFVVFPILSIVGLMPLINQLAAVSPWYGLLKGLIITGGMVAVTVFTVRMKWFWKT